MGSYVCTQGSKVTDKAMFIVFDIDNEACLSGIGIPGDCREKSIRGPQDLSWLQLDACGLARARRTQGSWTACQWREQKWGSSWIGRQARHLSIIFPTRMPLSFEREEGGGGVRVAGI